VKGWEKLAISGATYARALTNAATRGGRALSPAMLEHTTQIAARPGAQLRPGLGQFFREHGNPMHGGALPMTPQRAAMQDLAHHIPWAGKEHTTDALSAQAPARFDRLLQSRGLVHNTPAGMPSVNERIRQEFNQPRSRSEWQAQEGTGTGAAPEPVTGAGGPKAIRARTPVPVSQGATSVLPAGPLPSAPGRQFPRARFQMGKVGAALPNVKSASLPTAIKASVPGLALGAGMLLNKPGIKADLADRLQGDGDIRQKDEEQEIPEPVTAQAHAIAQALAAHGLDPKTLRIAVDAPPGAGKTVLSRALARETGMHHYGLDWRPNLGLHRAMGGGDIEKMPYAPHAGEILEHHQLLRSYDPEVFDAAIHLRRTPEEIRQNILRRGRGAANTDLFDYDKAIGVGDRAFDTLAGETIDLGNGTVMKLRPREGWGNALDQELVKAGIDPTGLSRHEKLLSLQANQRTTGAGWTPYVKNPFTPGETMAIGASIPLSIMAARALAQRA